LGLGRRLDPRFFEKTWDLGHNAGSLGSIHNSSSQDRWGLEAQDLNPKRTLDFTNLIASCNRLNQCGKAHKSQPLPLTPLMEACETELCFKISGRVEGLTDRATTTIQVLNLGDHETTNRALIEKRKQLSNSLLLRNGVDPNDGLEDEDLLQLLIKELAEPQNGQLESFAPVVINILRTWLSPQSNIRR
jgi:hypothetical protein